VVSHGSSGSTNRDNPKSVSFTNGPDDHESVAFRSLVKRMSEERISRHHQNGRDEEPTLEFNVAMDQSNTVHPSNSLAQFTPYLSQVGFVKLRVLLVRVDEIK